MVAILVTGGAGYIGSHVCKALSAAGFAPIVFDNLSRGHRWAVRWGPLIVGDLHNPRDLIQALRSADITAVIHLAAFAYIGESMLDPAPYWHNNVTGTYTLLEAMRAVGTKRIIFSSTCATYGQTDRLPLTEASPQLPINTYGATKLVVERMLGDFARSYDFKYVALRYFNAAGADPDGEIGELHDPEPHLIPNILSVARGEHAYVDILGDDYPTPDGTCVRDYVHVADIANAHVLALNYLLGGGEALACNLGTGSGYSVKEIVEAARRVTGAAIPCRSAPRRPGDPAALTASSQLAEERLGWHRRYCDIETIISHAWNWTLRQRPADITSPDEG